jgi:hypothetical protein
LSIEVSFGLSPICDSRLIAEQPQAVLSTANNAPRRTV